MYALSIAVVAGSIQQRAGAALVKGVIQALSGAAVLALGANLQRSWRSAGVPGPH